MSLSCYSGHSLKPLRTALIALCLGVLLILQQLSVVAVTAGPGHQAGPGQHLHPGGMTSVAMPATPNAPGCAHADCTDPVMSFVASAAPAASSAMDVQAADTEGCCCDDAWLGCGVDHCAQSVTALLGAFIVLGGSLSIPPAPSAVALVDAPRQPPLQPPIPTSFATVG